MLRIAAFGVGPCTVSALLTCLKAGCGQSINIKVYLCRGLARCMNQCE